MTVAGLLVIAWAAGQLGGTTEHLRWLWNHATNRHQSPTGGTP